jgi:hypothetical protein
VAIDLAIVGLDTDCSNAGRHVERRHGADGTLAGDDHQMRQLVLGHELGGAVPCGPRVTTS